MGWINLYVNCDFMVMSSCSFGCLGIEISSKWAGVSRLITGFPGLHTSSAGSRRGGIIC